MQYNIDGLIKFWVNRIGPNGLDYAKEHSNHYAMNITNRILCDRQTPIAYKSHDGIALVLDLRGKVSVTTTRHINRVLYWCAVYGVQTRIVEPISLYSLAKPFYDNWLTFFNGKQPYCSYAFPPVHMVEYQPHIPYLGYGGKSVLVASYRVIKQGE